MNNTNFLYAILAMTAVMVFFRIVPLLFFRNKVKNKFLQSFLAYIPCAVLTSMTIPEVFHSTSSVISASIGVVVAIILSYFEQSLIVVAVSSSVAVFVVEQIMRLV